MKLIENKKKFLEQYNITEGEFALTGLDWEQLKKIYLDFNKSINEDHLIENIQTQATTLLNDLELIHSIRYRIKDPEHLIAKIIRERRDKGKKDDGEITLQNYRVKIEDIFGIRLLHVFKNEWEEIHDFLENRALIIRGKTFAYYRIGDSEDFINKLKAKGIKIDEDDDGYRSIHYSMEINIRSKVYSCEIQVRTLFEEAWSEIGHAVRYPSNLNSPFLKNYFKIYNRFSGALDEMGTFIKNADQLDEKKITKKNNLIDTTIAALGKLSINKEELLSVNEIIENLRSLRISSHWAKPKKHLQNREEYFKEAIKCLNGSNGIYRSVIEGPFFLHPDWVVKIRDKQYDNKMPNYDVAINRFVQKFIKKEQTDIRLILRNSTRYVEKLEKLVNKNRRKKFKGEMLKNIDELLSKKNPNQKVRIVCFETGFSSVSEIYPELVLASDKTTDSEGMSEGWLYDNPEFVNLKTREFDKIFTARHSGNETEIKKLVDFINSLWVK